MALALQTSTSSLQNTGVVLASSTVRGMGRLCLAQAGPEHPHAHRHAVSAAWPEWIRC